MAGICANSYNTDAMIIVHVSIPNQSLNLLRSSQLLFIEETEQRREKCVYGSMNGRIWMRVWMDRERKMNGDGKMEEVGEWMGGWGWMS